MTACNVEIDNLSGKLIYKYHFAGLRHMTTSFKIKACFTKTLFVRLCAPLVVPVVLLLHDKNIMWYVLH